MQTLTPTPAPASGWEQFDGHAVPVVVICVIVAWLTVSLINVALRR